MKKITNFIVEKRYIILILCIVIAGISLYLGTKVTINDDISKYLPKTSETRVGMDIMNDNFEQLKESNLLVMFKGLSNSEKKKIKKKLAKIDNVSSVDFENTKEYNKGKYSLYTLNVSDNEKSTAATRVYNDVKDEFKDYDISLGGSISEANKSVLNKSVVIIAIFFAMLILIIMCNSYIEPFLFLFVILIAVCFNKGTNLIFHNVSNITDSISAILQMALSMDYSIMLMNRYTQEKEKNKDKVISMKKALYNAFKSISSSSVTTIVGLLALVFMSFTIGKDLGFVLAKGVLCSLISIFLCLPALILLFDNLIEKTKKKSLSLKLDKLGRLSYKSRYPVLMFFIILFGVSYLLKGGLTILYTGSENDDVAKHFKENNQIAIIYNNKYEDEVSKYCQNLNDKKLKEVMCYGNTINQKLTYDELTPKLDELNSPTKIDDYLLKILYYNYYNKENNKKISLNELIKFIENNIYSNDKFSNKIGVDMKDSLSKLKYFTSIDSINKLRTSSELSYILGIDEEQINSLLILYNSNSDIKIRLNDFVNFVTNDVLTNPKYSQSIDNEKQLLIKQVIPFTNKTIINSKLNSTSLSQIFNLDTSSIDKLLMLNYMNVSSNERYSLTEFITKITYIKENTNYLDDIDVSALTKLGTISKNENNINAMTMNKIYLNQYFSQINPTLVDMVYNGAGLPENYTMTPSEFITFTLTNFSSYLDNEFINNLKLLKLVIDDSISDNQTLYTVNEMSSLLNQDQTSINKLYVLINGLNGYEYQLTPVEFVNLILNNKDNEMLANSINQEMINKLVLLKQVMETINNDTYFTSNELSSILKLNNDDVKLLYSLYDINYLNKNIKVSLNDFTNFILNNVITNEKYSSSFDNNSINKLTTINKIMNDSLNNELYTANECYELLKNLSSNLDKNLIDLVYIYYGSINNYNKEWTLTVQELVNYLSIDIIKDSKYSNFIDKEMKTNIKKAKKMVDKAKKLLVSDQYSRMIINTTFDSEGKETFKFIQSIKDELKTKNKDIYVIGNSPMAYDISNSFGSELNFITLLTMIAIFIVVALTFKSLLIPTILVGIIQCAVFFTMGLLTMFGGNVHFIALLTVQSILMGATIDYAILYTSYYKESREKMNIVDSLKNAYNKSIHTILTSASILIIVTLVVGNFASAIAAKICKTISEGTFCSVLLILFILPSILAVVDKLICRKQYKK